MADLRTYGHSETDCLNHSPHWMNYTLEVHARDELTRTRLDARLQLQAAMLSGVMFNDPEKGMELYEQMVGQLSDAEDDDSDEAWIRNPNATTDASTLAAIGSILPKRDLHELKNTLERRFRERRRTADAAGNNAGGGDGGNSVDAPVLGTDG